MGAIIGLRLLLRRGVVKCTKAVHRAQNQAVVEEDDGSSVEGILQVRSSVTDSDNCGEEVLCNL